MITQSSIVNCTAVIVIAIWVYFKMCGSETTADEVEQNRFNKEVSDQKIADSLKSPNYHANVTEPRDMKVLKDAKLVGTAQELEKVKADLVRARKERNSLKGHCKMQREHLDILQKCLHKKGERLAWFEENYEKLYSAYHEDAENAIRKEDLRKLNNYSDEVQKTFEKLVENCQSSDQQKKLYIAMMRDNAEHTDEMEQELNELRNRDRKACEEGDNTEDERRILRSNNVYLSSELMKVQSENEYLSKILGIKKPGARALPKLNTIGEISSTDSRKGYNFAPSPISASRPASDSGSNGGITRPDPAYFGSLYESPPSAASFDRSGRNASFASSSGDDGGLPLPYGGRGSAAESGDALESASGDGDLGSIKGYEKVSEYNFGDSDEEVVSFWG